MAFRQPSPAGWITIGLVNAPDPVILFAGPVVVQVVQELLDPGFYNHSRKRAIVETAIDRIFRISFHQVNINLAPRVCYVASKGIAYHCCANRVILEKGGGPAISNRRRKVNLAVRLFDHSHSIGSEFFAAVGKTANRMMNPEIITLPGFT